MGYTYNSKMNLTTYIGGGPATGNEHTECAADPTGGEKTL